MTIKRPDITQKDGRVYRFVEEGKWIAINSCDKCNHLFVLKYSPIALSVCGECGSTDITVKVGRWNTYVEKLSILKEFFWFLPRDLIVPELKKGE